MKNLKADYDFFTQYDSVTPIFKSPWHYRWLFFRYLITKSGLFVLGLRLGAALYPFKRLQALYFFFFNIFWHCDISPPVNIGPGLFIPHPFGIVIGPPVIIGKNCVLFNDTTFGKKYPGTKDGMPLIGDNILVGAGARLLGGITIGDDVVIGCNSVVTKSVPDRHTVVGVNRISETGYRN